MNRFGWIAAAILATAFLAALAFTGGRGGPGLAPFTPAGLLTIPAEQVREVEVTSGDRRWYFVRGESGWRAERGTVTAGFEGRLEGAVTLLRNSGPERILTDAELAGVDVAQFGLDPPRSRVILRGSGADSFAISFGAANLLGLSRYARLDDKREIALLPGFVPEAWEQLGGAP
ncbi:hypothetical protein V1294_005418 [Bradyrhizobium sp. AZCC 1678]|uniref:hypothetical protein n=1 Tax=Bradyrhizobium sp. AZCC 1678 TaxID=3117030 RepID=UPI002FF281F5